MNSLVRDVRSRSKIQKSAHIHIMIHHIISCSLYAVYAIYMVMKANQNRQDLMMNGEFFLKFSHKYQGLKETQLHLLQNINQLH